MGRRKPSPGQNLSSEITAVGRGGTRKGQYKDEPGD